MNCGLNTTFKKGLDVFIITNIYYFPIINCNTRGLSVILESLMRTINLFNNLWDSKIQVHVHKNIILVGMAKFVIRSEIFTNLCAKTPIKESSILDKLSWNLPTSSMKTTNFWQFGQKVTIFSHGRTTATTYCSISIKEISEIENFLLPLKFRIRSHSRKQEFPSVTFNGFLRKNFHSAATRTKGHRLRNSERTRALTSKFCSRLTQSKQRRSERQSFPRFSAIFPENRAEERGSSATKTHQNTLATRMMHRSSQARDWSNSYSEVDISEQIDVNVMKTMEINYKIDLMNDMECIFVDGRNLMNFYASNQQLLWFLKFNGYQIREIGV